MSIGGRTEFDPAARMAVRQEWRVALAMRGGWPELPRKHIRFERLGTVIDERDDSRYRVHRGEVDQGTPAVVAFFFTEYGDPVFLERMPR